MFRKSCVKLGKQVISTVSNDVLKSLKTKAITWKKTGDPITPYEAVHNGRTFLLRTGDFPAEPLYTLVEKVVPDVDLLEIDDFPTSWRRP